MGFRSTLISEDVAVEFPDWFVEKWAPLLHFGWTHDQRFKNHKRSPPISTKGEIKEYMVRDLYTDLQRVLSEYRPGWAKTFDLVWLHECGGITKVTVTPEKVWFGEPYLGEWKITDAVEHFYCYGCTELRPVVGSTVNPDAPKWKHDQPPDKKSLYNRD